MKRKKIIISIMTLFMMLSMCNSTVFALEPKINEPELVTAPSNSLIEYPSPRVTMDVPQPIDPHTKKSQKAVFPEKYDLRDQNLVTSIKNQGNFGTCWAFAAMSCAETSAISANLTDSNVNLSEAHLAYFYYNRAGDPLGNTTNDKNVILQKDDDGKLLDYKYVGGDDKKTILALSGWTGAADESVFPYESLVADKVPSIDQAFLNSYILKNASILPTDISIMKQAIMDQKTLNIGYYSDPQYSTDDGVSAYCNEYIPANHEVVIVGWDDHYNKANFKEGIQPKKNGAWIVKNSWGTKYGDQGYFYLSYEDQTLCDAVSYEFQSADTYDHNYQYDGTSGFQYWQDIKAGDKFSNVYQIKGNDAGFDESLSSIGFVSYSPGTEYAIQIYKDLRDPNDPESGTALLEHPVTGIVENSGFMTKDLGTSLILPQKTTYSIVITFTKIPPEGATIGLEMDDTIEDYMDYQAETAPQQSFINERGKWDDMADANACFRIKGFTVDQSTKTSIKVQSLQLSKTYASLKLGETLTLNTSFFPAYASDQTLTWKSSNQSAATVDARGNITATGPGTTTITAVSSSNPSLSANCHVTVAPLGKPSIKTASARYDKVRISWKKVPLANGYQIYRSTSKNKGYKRIKTTKGTSYTNRRLKTGKTYYYKVRAYKSMGRKTVYGSFSKPSKARPKPGKATLKLTSKKGKVTAKWSKVSGASGYQLYRSKKKNGTYMKIRQTKKCVYTNTCLKKKKRYYYKVRAYKTMKGKKIYGSFSIVKSAKTK